MPDTTVEPSSMQTREEARRGRWARRVTLSVLALFVLAGMFDVFGYKDRTSTARTDAWELSVSHATVTRGGLPSNWQLEVRRLDGDDMPEEVELRSKLDYFSIYDENGFEPAPDSEYVDGDDTIWTFRPPPGSTSLVIDFDARVQPNARWKHEGRTTVVVDGEPVVSVDYDTWVVP